MSKSLGKGLGALIAAFDEENENLRGASEPTIKHVETVARMTAESAIAQGGVQEIDISLIDNNVNQPRKSFDAVALQELADSITANGIFQPILVNRVGSRFLIIAGERRWRAAKLAGLSTVPVIVRDYSPRQLAEVALVENLQREDLTEVELARGIKKLMDEFFLTQEKVSTVLGKSRSAVANILRLLTLPKEVQQMIESRQLSAGHAKCLVAVVSSDKCVRLARQCVVGNLSVRELENLIRDDKGTGKPATTKKQSLEMRQIILEISQSLGTKVQVQGDEISGKILVEYFDKKDFERLVQKLKN